MVCGPLSQSALHTTALLSSPPFVCGPLQRAPNPHCLPVCAVLPQERLTTALLSSPPFVCGPPQRAPNLHITTPTPYGSKSILCGAKQPGDSQRLAILSPEVPFSCRPQRHQARTTYRTRPLCLGHVRATNLQDILQRSIQGMAQQLPVPHREDPQPKPTSQPGHRSRAYHRVGIRHQVHQTKDPVAQKTETSRSSQLTSSIIFGTRCPGHDTSTGQSPTSTQCPAYQHRPPAYQHRPHAYQHRPHAYQHMPIAHQRFIRR